MAGPQLVDIAKGPARMNRRLGWLLCISVLVLIGCAPAKPKMLAAPVTGYNHTSAAINSFSVNGAGGPNLALIRAAADRFAVEYCLPSGAPA